MGKEKRKIMSVDVDVGIWGIIPSTQEAYTKNGFNETIRKEEKAGIVQFKERTLEQINAEMQNKKQFPTSEEVFIFIVQYFALEREYKARDVDNMAKTVLDIVKNKFYKDDNQVKTLLVSKKLEKRVPENFAYIAIKELKNGNDAEAIKVAGLERSITLFQELSKKAN